MALSGATFCVHTMAWHSSSTTRGVVMLTGLIGFIGFRVCSTTRGLVMVESVCYAHTKHSHVSVRVLYGYLIKRHLLQVPNAIWSRSTA